jgi:hypothetical protein
MTFCKYILDSSYEWLRLVFSLDYCLTSFCFSFQTEHSKGTRQALGVSCRFLFGQIRRHERAELLDASIV